MLKDEDYDYLYSLFEEQKIIAMNFNKAGRLTRGKSASLFELFAYETWNYIARKLEIEYDCKIVVLWGQKNKEMIVGRGGEIYFNHLDLHIFVNGDLAHCEEVKIKLQKDFIERTEGVIEIMKRKHYYTTYSMISMKSQVDDKVIEYFNNNGHTSCFNVISNSHISECGWETIMLDETKSKLYFDYICDAVVNYLEIKKYDITCSWNNNE